MDERRIRMAEEKEKLARQRMEAATTQAAKKIKDGKFGIDDINALREKVFGMPPLEAVTHA